MPLCSLYISNSMLEPISLLNINNNLLFSFAAHVIFFIIFYFFEAQVMPWPRADQDSSTRKRIQNETLEIPSEFPFVCTLFSTYIVSSDFDNDMSFIQSGHLYCLLVSHWVGKEKVLFGNSFAHFLFSCKFHSAWKDGCCWGKGTNLYSEKSPTLKYDWPK